ncbi:hypothetical protein WJS89_10435 [Sphingomicrobium sp. XHP0235]|uniref:hypothetical protein n=1 Tax=Sphingomicrobium aquimarinum TaxID=3133971 RepID=UPI0031FF05EB
MSQHSDINEGTEYTLTTDKPYRVNPDEIDYPHWVSGDLVRINYPHGTEALWLNTDLCTDCNEPLERGVCHNCELMFTECHGDPLKPEQAGLGEAA